MTLQDRTVVVNGFSKSHSMTGTYSIVLTSSIVINGSSMMMNLMVMFIMAVTIMIVTITFLMSRIQDRLQRFTLSRC